MEKINLIPLSIEADTRDELTRKMMKINMVTNSYHRYFDIQKDGRKWVAWYYEHVELEGVNVINKK